MVPAGARRPARRTPGRCGETRRADPRGAPTGPAGLRSGAGDASPGPTGRPRSRSIGEPAAVLGPVSGFWSGTTQLLSGGPGRIGRDVADGETLVVDDRGRDLERAADVVADVLGRAWASASGSAWGRRGRAASGSAWVGGVGVGRRLRALRDHVVDRRRGRDDHARPRVRVTIDPIGIDGSNASVRVPSVSFRRDGGGGLELGHAAEVGHGHGDRAARGDDGDLRAGPARRPGLRVLADDLVGRQARLLGAAHGDRQAQVAACDLGVAMSRPTNAGTVTGDAGRARGVAAEPPPVRKPEQQEADRAAG